MKEIIKILLKGIIVIALYFEVAWMWRIMALAMLTNYGCVDGGLWIYGFSMSALLIFGGKK